MSTSNTTPKPILDALKAALSSGPAQKREDEYYKPRLQPYWWHDGSFDDPSGWVPSPNKPPPTGRRLPIDQNKIRLISWNIDMLIGFAEERMSAAIQHLSQLVESVPPSTPTVIFLQEMSQSDLKQIRETKWVQIDYFITEFDERNWLSPLYGTTMLIDRRLKIEQVFRVPWISKFERDGLFVDIGLAGQDKVLRLCNVHLESLVADPPVRPLQLQAAAPYLHESKVAAALLAGDLNAIQPFDRTLHSENNLKDTYLELGGEEDSDDGFTWGYQVPQALREKFGCSRMDKILFTGALQPRTLERIGIDVKVAAGDRQKMRDAGEEEWVTDHYGVDGLFELSESYELIHNNGAEANLRPKLS